MDDDQEVQEVDNETNEDSEIEAKARAGGWRPQEEYEGDPKKWRSAKEFVEFGEQLAPALKKQRDAYKAELDEYKRQMDGYKKTVEELAKRQLEKERKEHEQQIEYYKTLKRNALQRGEHAEAATYEDEIEKLKDNKPAEFKPPVEEVKRPPEKDPAFVEWLEDNPWYTSNTRLGRLADAIGIEMRENGNTLQGRRFFDAVAKRMREEYPDEFKKRRSAVESSSNTTAVAKKGDISYSRLSPEEKRQCDIFVNEDKFGTREEWLRMYQEMQ